MAAIIGGTPSTPAVVETFLSGVRNLSQQGNFASLSEHVNRNIDTLSKHPLHLDNALAAMDIQQHSLGVLGILIAKYNVLGTGDVETLLTCTQEFVAMCNGEHIRYAKDLFADLSHKLTQHLIDRKQAIRGISILKRAIVKIQLSPSQLTSIHADLCQLCLVSKCMQPAIELLDADISDISKESGQYDAKHFLLYYYYGGMIYASLKNFDRALFFFEIAVTTPSMAVSHIMLEAYKKLLLVSLICNGKNPVLPRYTSHIVSRYIRPLCQAYHDFATVYVLNSRLDINMALTNHTDLFTRDRNMGLVKQCMTAMYKKNIQRLTKTFITLSLTDMANRVQLSSAREAEQYVLHMIENCEIFATINQKDGMVTFHENPEKYNSIDTMMQLDQQMATSMGLVQKLQEMDREIMVNPQYVQKSSGLILDDDLPGSSMKIPIGHIL